MPFFDFHLHPSLKTMFSQEQSKTNPWVTIDPKIIPWIMRWCTDFEYILGSQAGLGQLSNVHLNLVCVPLYTPEWGISRAQLLVSQAKGSFTKLLDPVQLHLLASDDANPYQLAKQDIDGVLLNPERFKITNKKVKALTRPDEYDPNDKDTIYVVFSVEGAHTLSDSFLPEKVTAANVLKNLDDLRNGHAVLSVNLTHLEQYPLCTHAFGILFVDSGNFQPTGNRISTEGITVVKECYKRKIMVDIKHMSLASRRHLIEEVRKQEEFSAINQPIVCTHAGFAGLSYRDIPDYLNLQAEEGQTYSKLVWGKPKRYTYGTAIAFNPTSINLYDEDILAVLQSGGLVGLSMDKRILGYSGADHRPDAPDEIILEEELVSNAETGVFLTKKRLGGKIDDSHCITTAEVSEGGVVNPQLATYHLAHFMAHVLHLIGVASRNNYPVEQALKQICLGSDFDGIINPIWCCPTTESLPAFKQQFINEFPLFAKENKSVTPLPAGFDVQQVAEQLFFENGRNFVMKRLAVLAATADHQAVPLSA